jgi:hypothetical protein
MPESISDGIVPLRKADNDAVRLDRPEEQSDHSWQRVVTTRLAIHH